MKEMMIKKSFDQTEYPFFHAVLYGDKVSTEKFSKRLSCATKHLPLRVQLTFEHDSRKAAEKGIAKDPTLTLDGKIFLEGLVQAETIAEAFETVLIKKKRM